MSRRRIPRASPAAFALLDEMLAENTRERDARTVAARTGAHLACPRCGTAQPAGESRRAKVKMFCWSCMRNTAHVLNQGSPE
jgi:hypothetical protein